MSKRSTRRKKKAAQAKQLQTKATQNRPTPQDVEPRNASPKNALTRYDLPSSPSPHVIPMSNIEPDNSPPWKLSTKLIVTISAMALSVLVLWRFIGFVTPAILGAIVAYLLNPLIRLTSQRLKVGRGWAVAIVYVLAIIVVVIGGTLLVLLGLGQLQDLNTFLAEQFPKWVADLQTQVNQYVIFDGQDKLTVNIGGFSQEYQVPLLGVIFDTASANDIEFPNLFDFSGIISRAGSILQTTFSTGGSFFYRFAQGTIGFVGNLALVIFISIYLAKDTPRFVKAFTDAAHVPGYGKDADRLIFQFEKIWSAYLRGQVTLAITIFLVVGIALSALGVNNAWGLAVVSGVTEFLPLIGPVIGAGVAIIAALLQTSNSWGLQPLQLAIIVTVVMVIIQQVENAILVPRIVGGALDLHPLLVLVGVLMGTSIGGILGALLAAPVLATVKLLGRYAWRKIFDLPPFDDADEPEAEAPSLLSRAGHFLHRLRGNRPLVKGR